MNDLPSITLQKHTLKFVLGSQRGQGIVTNLTFRSRDQETDSPMMLCQPSVSGGVYCMHNSLGPMRPFHMIHALMLSSDHYTVMHNLWQQPFSFFKMYGRMKHTQRERVVLKQSQATTDILYAHMHTNNCNTLPKVA